MPVKTTPPEEQGNDTNNPADPTINSSNVNPDAGETTKKKSGEAALRETLERHKKEAEKAKAELAEIKKKQLEAEGNYKKISELPKVTL